jgi:hypothetical protein
MGWIRDLSWSLKAGLAVLLVAGLTVGGVVVLGGGSDGGKVEVLGASVKSTPPPTITSSPSDPTSATTATFTYADTQSGVGFQCQLDGAAAFSPSPCAKSGVTYTGLAVGSHKFRVAAQSGNGPLSAPTTFTWSVVSPPPTPTITAVRPFDPTADPEATFGFTDTQANVTFECKLDGGPFVACPSPKTYTDLAVGGHVFQVRAVDTSHIPSAAASFSWTIVTGSFGISGNLTATFPATDATLAPGVSRPLNLAFTNPYSFSGGLKILSVTVTVQQGPNAGCRGSENIAVTQASFTAPLTVPRNTTWSLSALGVDPTLWPQIKMINQPWDQEACKGTTFNFSYTGTATK